MNKIKWDTKPSLPLMKKTDMLKEFNRLYLCDFTSECEKLRCKICDSQILDVGYFWMCSNDKCKKHEANFLRNDMSYFTKLEV